MNIRQFTTCFAIIVLLPRFSLFAQIGIKFSGETGFFQSTGSSITTNSHLALRFDALGSYKFADRENSLTVKLRVRPKYYGLTNPASITKYSAESNYIRRSKKLNWGLTFVRQFYQFHNLTSDINFDILQLQGSASRNLKSKWTWFFYGTYFYRDLNANAQNSLDATALGTQLHWLISRYSKLSVGFYAEKFNIENSDVIGIDQNLLNNSGWRIGPEIGYRYQRKIVFKIDYHFYNIQSDLPEDLNAEHSLRILFGKIINKQWSVFVMLDTYLRNTPVADSLNYSAIYTPLNNERNIYSKIDYKIDKQKNLFLKLEYAKDELFLQNLSFTSRQLTMGMEWRR